MDTIGTSSFEELGCSVSSDGMLITVMKGNSFS